MAGIRLTAPAVKCSSQYIRPIILLMISLRDVQPGRNGGQPVYTEWIAVTWKEIGQRNENLQYILGTFKHLYPLTQNCKLLANMTLILCPFLCPCPWQSDFTAAPVQGWSLFPHCPWDLLWPVECTRSDGVPISSLTHSACSLGILSSHHVTSWGWPVTGWDQVKHRPAVLADGTLDKLVPIPPSR